METLTETADKAPATTSAFVTLTVPLRYKDSFRFVRDNICRRIGLRRPESLAITELREMYLRDCYHLEKREHKKLVTTRFADALAGMYRPNDAEKMVEIEIELNVHRDEDFWARALRDFELNVARCAKDGLFHGEYKYMLHPEAEMVMAMIHFIAVTWRRRGKEPLSVTEQLAAKERRAAARKAKRDKDKPRPF